MSLINLFRSFLLRTHTSVRVNPAHDWFVILMCAAIALIGIFVWNAWAFDTISSGGVIGSPERSPTTVINYTSLEAVQEVFKFRTEEEAKYIKGVYRFIDPSQ